MKKFLALLALTLGACGVDGEPSTPGAETTKSQPGVSLSGTASIGIAKS